ncbi:MAG: hypothetical protein M3Q69_04810, partial [Acidobacteriota bacterium]|nr:hypothetical protein [Acidobacteriota bacterium]
MIALKVKAAELRDEIVDQAKSAGQNNDRRITESIVAKAEYLDLPVTEDDIEIERKAAEIKVDVTYTVPVDFPGYTYQWNFHHHTENPIF